MSFKLQNPEQFRENIRKKISTLLTDKNIMQQIADKHSITPTVVAINFEKGIFNYTIRECNFKKLVKKWENPTLTQIYIDRLRMVFNNISSPTITNGLISGDILPQAVAFMTHQEIQADKWNPLIEKKTKRDASKCDKKVGASTAMFTCSRCKSKNCTYYEMQTRSADEPATIFITCLNCDKHWRN
jgi:DNA-directed RNA polymerase subunit M/transcription elongation factor TFIIS